MFAFDGQFKSRPIVSLGGASKKEQRNDLIQRAQEERQRREDQRLRILSAIKIQSFLRAQHVCYQQYCQQRAIFDEEVKSYQKAKVPDPQFVTVLTRRLLFFFSTSKDTKRLVWLCQMWLKHLSSLRPSDQDTKYTLWLYQVKKLLLLCCRSLDVSLQDSSPVGVQLRMLEVFSSPQSFSQPKDAMGFTIFLIQNGYFRYLRALINLRVPSSLEPSSTPPTPLAGALADLVMRPIIGVCQRDEASLSQDTTDRRYQVMSAFASDLLSPEMSEQITCFLLPVLATPSSKFPFPVLVDAVLRMLKSMSSTSDGAIHGASPWLLYAMLVLAENHLGSLSITGLLSYVQVLQYLLPWLPSPTSSSDYEDDEEDYDSEMEMMVVQDEKLNSLRARCLEILDSREHVKSLESLVTTNVNLLQSTNWNQVHELVAGLCSVCHHLMIECRLPVYKTRLLYTLALKPSFIRQLWNHILQTTIASGTGKAVPLVQMIYRGQTFTVQEAELIVPMVAVFCALFSHTLFSIHDQEFYGEDRKLRNSVMPFKLKELIPMTCALRDVIIGVTEIIYPDSSHAAFRDHYITAMKSVGARSAIMKAEEFYPKRKWIHLLREVTHLVEQLHSRDTRRQFCPDDHWLSPKIHIDPNQMRIDGFFDEEGTVEGIVPLGMSSATARSMSILQHIPFVVPFKDRVKLLQRIINEDRDNSQGDLHSFMIGHNTIDVRIQRKYLYQDAFDNLNEDAEPNMKKRVRVQLINEQGLEEAGVDGGGLFREFLNELLKAGFDQSIGFFKATHERLLYPNPQANLCAPNYLKHFRFLGRMLGKAIYENMLVELPFASFFLCKMIGRHGTDVDIHNLESLDTEVYKNLLFLKTYEGNVEDLALNFTIVNNDFGEKQVVELLPGGRDIPVTNSNRITYIHLVADYRLNKQIRAQCLSFRAGLAGVVNLDWLRMFDTNEIQVLISGAPVPVDLEDLKRNTNYSGGYTYDHPCIQSFWRVVEELNDTQKRQLLKFVTSCSRSPLLGFKDLYPAFCVHSAGQEDRLPSASTCMNMLKLPEYPTDEMMRERLLYAVESGAGFELS
ncbi:ubiquitin-protein ligase E3C [Nematostella vectensis]|uniref:ubiquitin-protein ligase E3C n=1 Tax=Nematostella vectensis TaxID=45351 RepID=UPI002077813B|nr:ubiquitin-protein ligase E3C [Nematostella vectensis]